MDLKPYLKLMIDKKADNLFLTANLAPCLEFSGQKKSVGQNKLSSDVLDTLFNDLTNEAQRLQYSIDNQVTVSAHLLDNQEFIIDISEKNDKYTITISKGQSSVAVIDSSLENIQVLGTAPKDNTLNILPYLQKIVELDGSDLFITAGSAVKTKIHGSAVALDNFLLTPEMTESAAHAIMDERQIKEFKETHDLDFAISLPDGSARFRVNAFYQRRTVGIVLRLIPMIIPTTQDLDLPDSLPELIMAKRGLLLMVGSTGSGKSTSLAAMINHRNMNVAGHILTIEDPVEFSHPNLKSIVNQREVGIDTVSYARALKASLREAPDVILIGEIRDAETMAAALELANTGHLCISTLHSNNANQAMERIINMFPQVQHKQLFMDLATNLNAVVSQRLIPDMRGKRSAAIEVLINTPHIANLILKGDLSEIKEAMKTSGDKRMRTFDDALLGLYQEDRISLEEALRNADSRNDLEAKINFG